MKKTLSILFVMVIAAILSQPAHAESSASAERPWEKFSSKLYRTAACNRPAGRYCHNAAVVSPHRQRTVLSGV
jgi:hypothetical protein